MARTLTTNIRPLTIDLEYCFTIFSLLLVTASFNPIFYMLLGKSDSYTDSNPLKLATSIAVYLVASLLLLREQDSALRMVRATPIILLVMLLPIFTVLWSADPSTTLKRSLAQMLTVLFCIYLASRLSAEELFRRLLIVLFIGAVASLIYTAVLPGDAIQHGVNAGSWEGVYSQKNDLGRICSIAILLCVTFRPGSQALNLIRWFTAVCFIFLLAMSQSKTNWVIVTGGVCLLPVLIILQTERLAKWVRIGVLLVSVATLLFVVTVGADLILESIGRDATFSGRATLWRAISRVMLAQYFPLGAGYGAFFTEPGAVPALRPLLRYFGAMPNHAHSGYWNTWVDMGIPGALVLGTVIVQVALRLFKRLMTDAARPIWKTFTLMVFIFLVNSYSESVAFRHSDIAWVLVILSLLYAAQPPIVAARIEARAEYRRRFAPGGTLESSFRERGT